MIAHTLLAALLAVPATAQQALEPGPLAHWQHCKAAAEKNAAAIAAHFKGGQHAKRAAEILAKIKDIADDSERRVRLEAGKEKVSALSAGLEEKISSGEAAKEKTRIDAAKDYHLAYVWGNAVPRFYANAFDGALPEALNASATATSYTRETYLKDLASDPVQGEWATPEWKKEHPGARNISSPTPEGQ